MKKILCLLIMSVMILGVGIVSAESGVDFVYPLGGEYISEDFVIDWYNNESITELTLQHLEGGDCDVITGWEDLVTMDGSVPTEYSWDISGVNDGQHCLRLRFGEEDYAETGPFAIDTTAPNITFDNTPYFVIKNSSIIIDATLVDGNLVKNYTINFGDTSAVVNADVNSAIGFVNQSHTYNTSGQYTVTITARDNTGNSAVSTKIVTVNDAEPDWVIELSASSMNMFSIPLIPESIDIEDVLDESISDNAEKIWSYQEGAWKYNTPTSSGWSTTTSRLQEIVPGYGYIIFMEEDAVVYGSGKELGADVPPEVTLTTGWNLIGHYGLDEVNVNADNAFESLELGENDYWYNLLAVNNDGDFEIMSQLQPTEAYWLSIKSINLEEDELRYFTYFPSQGCY